MQMHNAAIAQLERALLLLRLGEREEASAARECFGEIVSFYAARYPEYALHGDDPSCQGRVQPHRLNEAVWINGLLRAARWSGLSESWPAEMRSGLQTMALLAVGLLRPQVNAIHNHHTWLLAALAECAVLLRDRELLAWCRDSAFGMDAQLRQGFLADGFWHEASITYHYYALESVLAYLEAAGPDAFSIAGWRDKLVLAINNPPLLAYADGRMPAYADGWPDTFLHDYAHLVETAWALLGNEVDVASYHRNALPACVRLMNGGGAPAYNDTLLATRASVAALVYGPDGLPTTLSRRQSEPVVVMAQTGIAVLRNENVRLALRFGPDGGWHDHRDKLNVDVETPHGWRSLDLGTSGYDSDFTRWLRSPHAHNLIVVDGSPQAAHSGRLLSVSDSHVEAGSSYGHARFERSIRLSDDGWLDDYSVTLAAPRRIEWVFHGDGHFIPDATLHKTTLPGQGGFEWLKNARKITCGNLLRGCWRHGKSSVHLGIPVPPQFTAYCTEAPGREEGHPLGVVVIRGISAHETFRARFSTSAQENS